MNTKYKSIRLITTRHAHCPERFTLAHRRVYSYLAYRSRLGLGDSQRGIARESITDSRTTKKVLAFLVERKLVELRNGKWFALKPDEDTRKWFGANSTPKYDRHWSDHFCYSSLLIPQEKAAVRSKRFTISHSHVYSLLLSLGKANKKEPGVVTRVGVSRLSRMLCGLSPKTVRSALRVLESLRLVVCYQEGSYQTIHVLPVSSAHDHLFQKSIRNPAQETCSKQLVELQFKNEDMQSIYDDCRHEGIPIPLAKDITVAAAMACVDPMACDGYSEQAQLEHAQNRLAGKVTVAHHGHLTASRILGVFERLRIPSRTHHRSASSVICGSGILPSWRQSCSVGRVFVELEFDPL